MQVLRLQSKHGPDRAIHARSQVASVQQRVSPSNPLDRRRNLSCPQRPTVPKRLGWSLLPTLLCAVFFRQSFPGVLVVEVMPGKVRGRPPFLRLEQSFGRRSGEA